jgi:hypothetical protein
MKENIVTPEVADALINYLRAVSGFTNTSNDFQAGILTEETVGEDEELAEQTLEQKADELIKILEPLDPKTLIQIILDICGEYGDTSSEEGEARLSYLRTMLLEE